jgi:hypothetical protein
VEQVNLILKQRPGESADRVILTNHELDSPAWRVPNPQICGPVPAEKT